MDTTFGVSWLGIKVLFVWTNYKTQIVATAYLVDATADTITWILTQLFEMLDVQPKVLLTDYDKGI